MNWQAIGAIAEALGALAVVVSLVVVALEIRRNTLESKRQSMEDATSHRNAFVRMIATDPALASLVGKGLTGSGLSPGQWFQFNLFMYAIFVEFEFTQRKSLSGEMDSDLWEAWLEGYSWWLQFPGVRRWWSTKPAGFTASFRDFVDAQIASRPVAGDEVLTSYSRIGLADA